MSEDQKTLGRVEGKLDMLIAQLSEYQRSHDARHSVIDQSINCLKTDMNRAKGALAVLGLGTSYAVAKLLKWMM